MLDYRSRPIFLNGFRARTLCIVGLVVEEFLRLAFHERKGLNALEWHHAGACVQVKAAVVDGRRHRSVDVVVLRADAELALAVARAVVASLEEPPGRFRILDAIVAQRDQYGTIVGAHDLVCERNGRSGKSSVEVKLRQVNHEPFLTTVRTQLQRDSAALWGAATAPTHHHWAERVVVLVEWGPGPITHWRSVRADVLPVGKDLRAENWTSLWGGGPARLEWRRTFQRPASHGSGFSRWTTPRLGSGLSKSAARQSARFR